jgi:ribosomal protein L22
MSDEIEKTEDSVAETAATEVAASAETTAKAKPARKPRAAAKPKADKAVDETPAAGEAAAEEKPKAARKPRAAAKPKAEAADAEADAPEAASSPEVEEAVADAPKASSSPKTEKTADKSAAKAKAKPAAKAASSPTLESTKKAEPRSRRARRESQEAVTAPVVRAQAKYVRSSARKARLVCDNIRGKSVIDARAILAHTPRAVARDWSKLLESAIANAENNHDLDGEDLVIKAVHADEGPTIKRFRPRAMGRATQIRKRTAHLTILLTPKN